MAIAIAHQSVNMNSSHDVLDTGVALARLISAGLHPAQTVWSVLNGTAYLDIEADIGLDTMTGALSGGFDKIELQTGAAPDAPAKWTLTDIPLEISGLVAPMGDTYHVSLDIPGVVQVLATVNASTLALVGQPVLIDLGNAYPTLAHYVLREADSMTGSSFVDFLFGYDGNDTINGGGGNDKLDGGSGNDRLNGDAGIDSMNGGIGSDNLNGGAGNDTLIYGAGDILNGGANTDTLTIASGNVNLTTAANPNNRLVAIEQIDLRVGVHTLTLNASDVIAMSPTDLVRVLGDGADKVDIVGPFTAGGNAPAGYTRYAFGGAVLVIDSDVTVI